MTAVTKTLYIEQGATFFWFFQLTHNDNSPVPLAGYECRMQVRSRQQQPTQVDVDSDLVGGIILGVDPQNYDATLASPVPSNGWVYIKIGADKTSLINAKSGLYDVELYDPNDATIVYRLWEGPTTDDPNITQAAGEPVLK